MVFSRFLGNYETFLVPPIPFELCDTKNRYIDKIKKAAAAAIAATVTSALVEEHLLHDRSQDGDGKVATAECQSKRARKSIGRVYTVNTMNPADFGMFWMNQYAQAQERMIIDDSTSYYTQPAIGMSVMDDIGHQTSTMVSPSFQCEMTD